MRCIKRQSNSNPIPSTTKKAFIITETLHSPKKQKVGQKSEEGGGGGGGGGGHKAYFRIPFPTLL